MIETKIEFPKSLELLRGKDENNKDIHGNFNPEQHWVEYDKKNVTAQAACWLFCWAKTGQGSQRAAEKIQELFDEIFSKSFAEFDKCVPHEWARIVRRSGDKKYDEDLANLLGLEIEDDAPSTTQVPPDFAEPPKREESTTYRILRDTKKSRYVKQLHGYRCQIPSCEFVMKFADGSLYAEGHHVIPLGNHEKPGLDNIDNIVCVCPNHHALLDYGVIQINELRNADGHEVSPDSIDFHNNIIFKR